LFVLDAAPKFGSWMASLVLVQVVVNVVVVVVVSVPVVDVSVTVALVAVTDVAVVVVVVVLVVVVSVAVVVVNVGRRPGHTAWCDVGVSSVEPYVTASCDAAAALSACAAVHEGVGSTIERGRIVMVIVNAVADAASCALY